MYFYYKNYLKSFSQANRRIPTKAEGLFWNMIIKGNRLGYRFVRQKPIGGYILDFYCPKLRLGIEIDGSSHEGRGDYDQKRDEVIGFLGIKIVRYHDKDVIKRLEAVSLDIGRQIEERVGELSFKNPPSA